MKRRRPKNSNPIAKALRHPMLKPKVVRPKKGKGSYVRKKTTTT